MAYQQSTTDAFQLMSTYRGAIDDMMANSPRDAPTSSNQAHVPSCDQEIQTRVSIFLLQKNF